MKELVELQNQISSYADDSDYKDQYGLFRIGDVEAMIDKYRYLCFKIESIKKDIDVVWKVIGDDKDVI